MLLLKDINREIWTWNLFLLNTNYRISFIQMKVECILSIKLFRGKSDNNKDWISNSCEYCLRPNACHIKLKNEHFFLFQRNM